MSKLPREEDLPPTYTEATTSSSSSSHPSSPPSTYTTYLSTHLTTLTSRIHESQQAHTAQQAASDADILTLLIPHVDALLSSLGSMPHPPSLAEMTLVPAAAVPADWSMTGADERRSGEVRTMVRIVDKLAGPTGEKPSGQDQTGTEVGAAERERQFDEWGRWDDEGIPNVNAKGSWWWGDEEMARRLARHLHPQPQPRVDRQTVRTVVEKAKEERKASRWGLFKSGETSSQPAASSATKTRIKEPEEDVVLTVRPEEVTFRKENEFGIWASMSGWGIVVRVRIRRP